jgi:tetratricopeptide (TPR) repeat protein
VAVFISVAFFARKKTLRDLLLGPSRRASSVTSRRTSSTAITTMPSLSAEDIAAVRRACDAARANSADAPACLLELVMDWGGSVPPAEPPFPDAEEDPSGPADPEVVAPEADAPVAMGPEVAPELSEKEMDEVMETKQKAADAFADGRFEDAIDAYTVVIQSMPSALVYAKRAEAFVRLRKCVAAIRDCDAALAINPDSAKALKTRGAANRFLGNWERAHADLAKGQAIDFDETSAEIQRWSPSATRRYTPRGSRRRRRGATPRRRSARGGRRRRGRRGKRRRRRRTREAFREDFLVADSPEACPAWAGACRTSLPSSCRS